MAGELKTIFPRRLFLPLITAVYVLPAETEFQGISVIMDSSSGKCGLFIHMPGGHLFEVIDEYHF